MQIEPHKQMHYFSLIEYIRNIFKTRPDLVKQLEYPQTRTQPPAGIIGNSSLHACNSVNSLCVSNN